MDKEIKQREYRRKTTNFRLLIYLISIRTPHIIL